MKRILGLILSTVLLVTLLCGCSLNLNLNDDTNPYLVSAFGFDKKGNKTQIYIEALVVNSEDSSAEKELKILTGEGENVETAFSNATKKATGSLMLSHLGVVAVGDGITARDFNEICNFCYEQQEITLSAMLVSAGSAKDLLSCKPLSSVTVGYDVMSMISQIEHTSGTKYKNRFFEIQSARKKPYNIFALPRFDVKEENFSLGGLSVFKEDECLLNLSDSEAQIYAIATDNKASGKILLDGRLYEISRCYTSYSFSGEKKDTAQIKINLQIKGGMRGESEIIRGIEGLFLRSKEENIDIFGLFNIFYHKEKKHWEKTKQNCGEFYKGLKLEVKIV